MINYPHIQRAHLGPKRTAQTILSATAPLASPRIIERTTHGIQPRHISPNALKVVERLQQAGFSACIVGGCLRDLLLGQTPKDFDVATEATPEQIQNLFRNARLIGRRFRLAHVRFGREIIEVATYRGNGGNDDQGEGQRETADGRLLRDNLYGSEAEDALRRDFTINALMYDPATETLRDYAGGYDDVLAGRIRLIGDPATRYREDPVRLLRAIRFHAKLGLAIDGPTLAPIQRMASLLDNIPPARLFDEILKLFLTGHAANSYQALVAHGLWSQLFHDLFDDPSIPPAMVEQAMANTDQRVANDQPVTPGFLFAVLLWQRVQQGAERLIAKGMAPTEALGQAGDEVLAKQAQQVAIHRRYAVMAREIWVMQPRFDKCHARRARRMINERRFRAAYDFLLLRVLETPALQDVAQWWTDFQADPANARTEEQALATDQDDAPPPARRRRRRRRRKPAAP